LLKIKENKALDALTINQHDLQKDMISLRVYNAYTYMPQTGPQKCI
jgi:hypothetical protein